MLTEKPKRKKRGKLPNQRTLEECRKRGWLADIVERRLPHCFITKDFLGLCDVIALDHKQGVLGIQATSDNGGNAAARVTKLHESPLLVPWLAAGNRLQVWAWGKRGARGEVKRWRVREIVVGVEPELQITESNASASGRQTLAVGNQC